MAYHFMLICHLLVISNAFHPTKVSHSYKHTPIQVWNIIPNKMYLLIPWLLFWGDVRYRCDKNNECEKPGKHLQRMRQQIELTHFNKLSPSTPAENYHNLVYWFIRKNTHMCRHYGVKYKKIRFHLLHLIFLASFFLTKHKYIIFIYQHPWNHPLLQKAFRFSGESLEVAIHLNDIFLLIKKPCVTDYVYERQVSFNQLVNNHYLKCVSLKSPDHFSSRCWSAKLASISSSLRLFSTHSGKTGKQDFSPIHMKVWIITLKHFDQGSKRKIQLLHQKKESCAFTSVEENLFRNS